MQIFQTATLSATIQHKWKPKNKTLLIQSWLNHTQQDNAAFLLKNTEQNAITWGAKTLLEALRQHYPNRQITVFFADKKHGNAIKITDSFCNEIIILENELLTILTGGFNPPPIKTNFGKVLVAIVSISLAILIAKIA